MRNHFFCQAPRRGIIRPVKRSLLALIVLLAAAAPAAAASRPALHLVSRVPVVVRGAGFRHHERVTVTYAGRRVRVSTTSTGRFTARFPLGDRCSSGRVIAVGHAGERAILYIPPALCPPAAPGSSS
jgi:hypothetical protein